MKESNKLHSMDQGLNILNCIGYHWQDESAMLSWLLCLFRKIF